jgi:hypothetical protein
LLTILPGVSALGPSQASSLLLFLSLPLPPAWFSAASSPRARPLSPSRLRPNERTRPPSAVPSVAINVPPPQVRCLCLPSLQRAFVVDSLVPFVVTSWCPLSLVCSLPRLVESVAACLLAVVDDVAAPLPRAMVYPDFSVPYTHSSPPRRLCSTHYPSFAKPITSVDLLHKCHRDPLFLYTVK